MSITEQVKQKIEDGVKESEIRKFVRRELGLGKSQGNAMYNKIKAQLVGFPAPDREVVKTPEKVAVTSEKEKIKNLEFNKGYVFNKESKTYVVFLKSAARAILVSEETHNNMLRAYTSADSVRTEDICAANSFPHSLFLEYKTLFGWRRDSPNLTDEMVENNSDDELVEDIIQERRWNILQKSKKKIWEQTEQNSQKWMEFEDSVLLPFKRVVAEWEPCIKSPVLLKDKPRNGLKFICSLADNHLGEVFHKDKAYHGRDFNSEIACSIIDNYFEKIQETINSRSDKFSEGLIILTGDYLHSFVDGMTRKGTLLHSDKTNEDMFRIGLDVLERFVENFSNLFPRTRIFTTVGNHESTLLTYLAIALEKHFRYNPNISFEISDSWASLHRIDDIAMIITHGGNDKIKKDLPPMGLRLKNFVQELLLVKSDELVGCKSRIILSGHKHSYGQFDFGSFEFYCLGSAVLGDSYADALGLYSTPRQNCLVANSEKILETLHYYF